ncbi:hypothetical protein QEP13_14300 [Enterobacter ludwigii]|uniref:hypothetical protein n=1 Tax=Enterobacter TaxID=547 RepID=UPI001010C156|nr:hypothetical protein [Enterobacter cloacae]
MSFEDEKEAIDLFSKNPSQNDDGNDASWKIILIQSVGWGLFWVWYLSVNVGDKSIVIFVIERLFYC